MAVRAAFSAAAFGAEVKRLMGRVNTIVDESHVSALNKAAASTRAEAVRRLRKRYPGFKAGEIRSAMVIIRATFRNPVARIRIKGARTPLIAFSARQTKAGVAVRIKTRKIIRGAFIARMPSGHTGVFWRSGRKGRRGNPKLERIEQLYTLSLPQAIEAIVDSLRDYGLERYRIEFVREIEFRTARSRAA